MTRTLDIARTLLSALLGLGVAAFLDAATVSHAMAGTKEENPVRQGGPPGLSDGQVHHPGRGGPHFQESMREVLDLTDGQARALRRIRTDYDTMIIDKTAAIRVAEVELAALLEDGQPDLDAVEQKVRAIGALRTELMMQRVRALLKLKTILTGGQYSTFQDVLLRRMESLSEGHAALGH